MPGSAGIRSASEKGDTRFRTPVERLDHLAGGRGSPISTQRGLTPEPSRLPTRRKSLRACADPHRSSRATRVGLRTDRTAGTPSRTRRTRRAASSGSSRKYPPRIASAYSACKSPIAGSMNLSIVLALHIRAASVRSRVPGRLTAQTSARSAARRPSTPRARDARAPSARRAGVAGRRLSAGAASSREVMNPFSSMRPSVT